MSLWFRAAVAGVVLSSLGFLTPAAHAAKTAERWISDSADEPGSPAEAVATDEEPANTYVSDQAETEPSAVTGGQPCDDDCCTEPEACSVTAAEPSGETWVVDRPRRGLRGCRSCTTVGGCELGACGSVGCGGGGCGLLGCGVGGCLGCCLHRGDYMDRWANCNCDGSYKFPVPPLYTYHWPGMYSQQLMTDYHSPWRFPPLQPYKDESPILPEDELAQQEPTAGVRVAGYESAIETAAAAERQRFSVADKLERLYGERD